MLGLSVVIGRLADRWGRRAVLMGGALLFIVGAVTAPIFQNPLYNGASLLLVGLGWSLCYVAGNAMLADTTRPLERGRITGTNDLLVGLTGASASLAGGLLLSGAGFLTVGAVGLALGLLPFLLALRLKETSPGQYRE
jgi:MFS family permease